MKLWRHRHDNWRHASADWRHRGQLGAVCGGFRWFNISAGLTAETTTNGVDATCTPVVALSTVQAVAVVDSSRLERELALGVGKHIDPDEGVCG